MDHGGDAIVSMVFSLTIIPRVSVEYELVIIISYPTSARGIIVLTKTRTKYREFFPALFVNTTDFQLVFNFEQTRTWRAWYNGSYTMLAEPIRTLELHYPMIPMIQFLIISIILGSAVRLTHNALVTVSCHGASCCKQNNDSSTYLIKVSNLRKIEGDGHQFMF